MRNGPFTEEQLAHEDSRLKKRVTISRCSKEITRNIWYAHARAE